MAFSTKTRLSRFTLMLLISSLSYHITNSQNLDTASPIPKILENNDLGRIDVGIDEQNGVVPYEDEGGGGTESEVNAIEDYEDDDASDSSISLSQLLPNYDYDEGKPDPTLEAMAKREQEDYNDPTTFEPEVIDGQITLTRSGSPYVIKKDVLVPPRGTLNIEPGVTVRFKEAVGITVRGVLNADGGSDPMDQIRFIPDDRYVALTSPNRTIRLVDGPSVNEGIIQLLEGDYWRSVCTNSRNWTVADMNVACRQLGFTGGEWYHWYPHLNDTRQIMFQEPGCRGYEATMDRCHWERRKMGSGVCDHHPNLGLRCLPFHHKENRAAYGHWRGIRFESAPYSKSLSFENTLYVSISKSILRNVAVIGAGRGKFLGQFNTTSAIETWGVPPVMDHILVENSAYNGINITQPDSLVTITNANITNNRGYGVYVNTTRGYVSLEHSSVTNNFGDGIKYRFHDQRPELKRVDGVDVHDFCTYQTAYSQTYPFLMVAEQYEDSSVDRNCVKRFYTKHGYILTLHFVHLMAAVNDAVSIEVRDGSDSNSRLITTVDIKNYTRPESVVTTGNNMFIVFRAKKNVKTELFLEITAGLTKAYDLNVTDTVVADNNGRGIWVEWMRSALHVHHTKVSGHNHVAGVNVNWGAGDVNITHSRVIDNYVDGVNITYGGGNRNVSWSVIGNNVGRGIGIWLNETTVNTPVRQETTISYNNVTLNYDIGVLVGNFCGPAIVNISGNYFTYGRYIGLEVLSCWRDVVLEGGSPEGNTDLQIGHNHFMYNEAVATKLAPLVRSVGRIEHNFYKYNKDGCVYIHNDDNFILESQMVDLTIFENRFLENFGAYVLNLGLSHYNYLNTQKLEMRFNWVQRNTINEPWLGLNPRSRVAAPVVISSTNVKLTRNLIDNPESRYEIGSHLIEPNAELDCKNNWLGHKDEQRVWSRVFDRDDRYNLAKISYIPYLLSNNINTELVLERPEWEHMFSDENSREVGGEVTGVEELRADGVYFVRRDINVRPGGRLKITPGVTLKFEHSIGMMVSGEIIAEGDLQGGQPVFTLLDTVRENVSSVPIRLVGGKTVREGRLQVHMGDGNWGTVCNFGWTIESAALACQQMGWVLNPEDWLLQPNEIPKAGVDSPILLSNVRCDPLDTDITKCKLSERRDMFLNTCDHTDDVGLRCYDVSWAGIRLGMTAKRSKLYDVKVERAGLHDYRLTSDILRTNFKPAIQVDFSHHVFEHLEVSNNDYDGLGVLYSDIYFPDRVNYIKKSKFNGNKRHGISFRQLGMNIEETEIRDNYEAGIYQDPHLDKLEQRELTEWMSLIDEQKEGTIIRIPESTDGKEESNPIVIKEGESKLIMTQQINSTDANDLVYHIRAERDEFVLGIQLLNPFHNYTTEKLFIYDFRHVKDDDRIQVWNVTRDIASFPTISSSYAITLVFNPGVAALGNALILLTPINCADLPGNCNTDAYYINPIKRSKIVPGSFPRLTIQNSKITHNGQGISTLHYNRYLGHDSQVYLRKANESIEIYDSEISYNRREAFHVFTPFRELNQFNISEITYMINRTSFLDNGRGIFQYSKDLRDSNNLYHWVLRENLFQRNTGGGMDVALPYVWQYNENYTHTVHIDSNRMSDNRDFGITIRGHFARVYIVNNTITDNFCHEGLLAMKGMEKESWIFANNIQHNDGIFMVDFDMDSHSEIMGFVEAYFYQNIVRNNRHNHDALLSSSHAYHPASYTLGVKGVQKFNITDNIFGNQGLDYELLAGIVTARISNYLNAVENYWGSPDINVVRSKVFDFDDWNSYAIAHFTPYKLEASFDASMSSSVEREKDIDFDNLGGRLTQSMQLINRGRPYVIKSDLTVMPDVTLTIEPGVELEFYPSVGILVLGTLHAQGNIEHNIIMRPVKRSNIEDYRIGRHTGNFHPKDPESPESKRLEYKIDPFDKNYPVRKKRHLRITEEEDFDVRLCQANVNGTICPEGARQGFVELFNRTTMQWVPMCDKRFSERNAEVVCRQLGFSNLNVFLDFDRRIEYHAQSINRIIYWPEPYQCTGRESRLSHCDLRMNGQIYGHLYGCDWKGTDFVFVNCGETNLDSDYEYWGGVRFSVKEFEQELFHSRIHDAVTHSSHHKHESILEYVQIIGAGVLHGEKSPAVQTVMQSPLLSSINVSHSAHDGINLISPHKTMNMLYNKIENNLGVGISAAVLTGEVREADLSAFVPLENVPIPYNIFGLVDICDPQKEIVIEERILLYYKYDNNPVDCVKIFSSTYDVKPVGFRMLHYNFVNSSGEPWIPDHLTLYDGDLYNRTTEEIVTIKVDGSESERRLHKTTKSHAMSIKFHATGAREHLGFFAEVVTLPISVVGIDRDIKHNMSFSVFENNQRGAVHYTSAGEINPIVTMQRNQVKENCVNLYGNFSTCQSSILFDIQNTQDVFFHNNFITGNIGGLLIRAGSSGTATALRGILHNNVFEENLKKVTLQLEGRQTSPYQQITMYKNYITRSDIPHEPVVKFSQVVCNTSFNAFHNNKGKVIMEVTGFDNVRLPIYQSFTHNGFYNNFAYGLHCEQTTYQRCNWGSRATVVAGSAGQEYVDNIFYNLNNDYEMVTLNRSVWDVWKTPINAKYNYWGYNESVAVAGRIKDLGDEDGLLEVDFTPFQMNNKTLMSGKCQPGWTLLEDTCYKYAGGPMTYRQAQEFCKKDNATIPFIKNLYWFQTLTQYLEAEQEDWRYYDMVWVSDLDAQEDHCKVFVDRGVETVSCDFLLPTLCEMDEHPSLQVDLLKTEFIIAIVAAFLGILLILIVCCFWCCKASHRKKERFERRNSIRMSKSSLGSRSLASVASTGFTDINYRRRIMAQHNKNHSTGTIMSSASYSGTMGGGTGQRPSTATASLNPRGVVGSFDSLAKDGLNSTVEEDLHSSFDAYQGYGRHSTNPMGGAGAHNASGTLGSHLSPNGVGTANGRTFADMHDVHYASNNTNNVSYQTNGGQPNSTNYAHGSAASLQGDMIPNFNVNATVHSQQQQPSSNIGSMFDNGGYRPDTRTPIGMTNMGNVSSHRDSGLPGYSSNQNVMHAGNDDSVLNLKRELRDHLSNTNQNPDDGEDGSTPTATTASTSEQDGDSSSRNSSSDRGDQVHQPTTGSRHPGDDLHDYQTMDSRAPLYGDNRSSTFRPPSSETSVQKRSLPSVPPIPSEPGYAKPFAHTNTSLLSSPLHSSSGWNQNQPPSRPLDSPPRSSSNFDRQRNQSYQPNTAMSFQYEQQPPSQSSRLLETSLDDDPNTSVNFRGRRSRSVGQMLETNFDDPDQPSTSGLPTDDGGENAPLNSSHSRSLGGSGVFKLSFGAAPLETDM